MPGRIIGKPPQDVLSSLCGSLCTLQFELVLFDGESLGVGRVGSALEFTPLLFTAAVYLVIRRTLENGCPTTLVLSRPSPMRSFEGSSSPGQQRGVLPASLNWRIQGLSRIQNLREQAAEPVVHWFFQILLATEVALGRQDRGVA